MFGMSTDILLVEDDPRIRQVLELALRDHGYDVRSAATGEQALEEVASRRPDVLLLDLMLPGIDGLEVCRRMRLQGDLPIIAVTARGDSADVVAGLEAGADDYVTKPVVASVLAARIRAVLRRIPQQSSHTRIGDLEVLTDRAVVLRRGEELALTKTEYRLLCELAEHPGAVKTREELLHDVWGYDYLGDTRLLDVHVRRLRVKVEEDPGNPQLVLTVRSIGYRLAV
jgi:DNA-binding response OmpR family regulator